MVHLCDKPCGNKTGIGYCATTACINPKYSNIGTAQYGQGVQKCIVTNADRIRAMTDEELAEFIYKNGYGSCPQIPVCPQFASGKMPYTEDKCKACWLDWLKEECANG